MVQQPVFRPVVVQHDAADPNRPGERRRAAAGDGSCLLFLFSGHCRPCQVGVAAPVQQYAFHGYLLAVEPYPAFIHRAFGQADGEFRYGRCRPHPESQVSHREFPDADRPRQCGRAVRFLFRSRLRYVQPDIGIRQDEAGDACRICREVGLGRIQGQQTRRKAHVHARQRILVAGGDPLQPEAPDDDLFPNQGPQGDIQREPAAAEERIGLVDQQRVVHRQPERKGEPETFDGQIHPERPRGIADRALPNEILYGRYVEQGGNQYQDDEDNEQRTERIFDDLFQH